MKRFTAQELDVIVRKHWNEDHLNLFNVGNEWKQADRFFLTLCDAGINMLVEYSETDGETNFVVPVLPDIQNILPWPDIDNYNQIEGASCPFDVFVEELVKFMLDTYEYLAKREKEKDQLSEMLNSVHGFLCSTYSISCGHAIENLEKAMITLNKKGIIGVSEWMRNDKD